MSDEDFIDALDFLLDLPIGKTYSTSYGENANLFF